MSLGTRTSFPTRYGPCKNSQCAGGDVGVRIWDPNILIGKKSRLNGRQSNCSFNSLGRKTFRKRKTKIREEFKEVNTSSVSKDS